MQDNRYPSNVSNICSDGLPFIYDISDLYLLSQSLTLLARHLMILLFSQLAFGFVDSVCHSSLYQIHPSSLLIQLQHGFNGELYDHPEDTSEIHFNTTLSPAVGLSSPSLISTLLSNILFQAFLGCCVTSVAACKINHGGLECFSLSWDTLTSQNCLQIVITNHRDVCFLQCAYILFLFYPNSCPVYTV